MPISSEIKLRKVQNVPSDDVSVAGGTSTATNITGASNTEWITPMAAQETGVLDTNIERQYQGADLHNLATDSSTLANGFFYVMGMVSNIGSPALLREVSTSASDDSTKKRRRWMRVGSAIIVEDVVLNGTTQVAGAQNASALYRSRTLLSSNDSPTTLAGTLTTSYGASGPGTEIAQVQGGTYDWMTNELEFGFMASAAPTATWTNRKTDPSVTYSRARNVATQITVPFTIAAGSYARIVCRQTLQPTLPSASGERFRMFFGGDSV